MIGAALHENGPLETLEWIGRAEQADVPAVWLTSGSTEQMSLLAVAASRTSRIRLGTAIVPTWLRHPLLLAQQAAVVTALAPDRLVLGVGPSHRPVMENVYGVRDFDAPLIHLEEYVAVLRQAFSDGKVDFDGRRFHVHAPHAPRVTAPIMISALREGSFRLAGRVADGAIAWICPAPYLATRARGALEAAAHEAGRPAPRLIAHTFLCVTDDDAAVRAEARQRLAMYPRLPFYARMLAASGDNEGAAGTVSDRLIDAVVVHGTEDACLEKLLRFKQDARADEVIASLMVVGPDRASGLSAGLRVISRCRE